MAGISQGLLAVVTAGIATYIAVQQYRLERARWRMTLYDHRYKIFLAVAELIAEIHHKGKVSEDGLRKFNVESRDQSFFFASDIQTFLKDVHTKAVKLKAVQNSANSAEKRALEQWFSEKIQVAQQKFGEYLAIHDK